MKHIKLFEKFSTEVDTTKYIKEVETKMEEISDLVSDLDNSTFTYEIDNYGLEAILKVGNKVTKFIMDFDPLFLVRFVSGEKFEHELDSIEQGLHILEDCVQKCIGIHERKYQIWNT
jgi:hypothetical protein